MNFFDLPFFRSYEAQLGWLISHVKNVEVSEANTKASEEAAAASATASAESAETSEQWSNEAETQAGLSGIRAEAAAASAVQAAASAANIAGIADQVAVNTTRIDTIIGGTTADSDAELLDIRVIADGNELPTAGDAVRFGSWYTLADGYDINIADFATWESGHYINPSDGTLANNSQFSASDYLVIKPGTAYNISATKQVYMGFYTDAKVFISGLSFNNVAPWTNSFTTPANARYVRLSNASDSLSALEVVQNYTYGKVLKDDVYIYADHVIGAGTPGTVYTVKPSGGGDYPTLRAAFQAIREMSPNEGNQFTVEFYGEGGEYDLVTTEYPTITGQGLTIPPWTTLKGMGDLENNTIVARLPQPSNTFSTLNMYATASLENIKVIGKNTRYAVHDDFYDPTVEENGYRHITNVEAISEGTWYGRAWGAGIRSGLTWDFEDVIFDGLHDGTESGFSCHNNVAFNQHATIKMNNCRSRAQYNNAGLSYGMRFSSIVNDANEIINTVKLEGTQTNGLLFSEENALGYGSGMLWKCTGYANDTTTATIVNSDGENYQDRINLL